MLLNAQGQEIERVKQYGFLRRPPTYTVAIAEPGKPAHASSTTPHPTADGIASFTALESQEEEEDQ